MIIIYADLAAWPLFSSGVVFGDRCYIETLTARMVGSFFRASAIAILLILVRPGSAAGLPQPYAGPESCARCHKDISAAQLTTAMANTWKGATAPSLPPDFDVQKVEGPDPPLRYEVRRVTNGFAFSVASAQGAKTVLPVEAIIGGKRHGVSFLLRLDKVDGIPLARSTLLEARYAYSPHGSLILSPGFEAEKPNDLEGLLGRTLSKDFERRCLTCHGQPGTLGAAVHGGVRCESCHGPAADHVASMRTTNRSQAPLKPETLSGARVMEVCGQCHTGLSSVAHSDPVPGDLLVSSQVPALRHSECFIQSGEGLSCTDCHDPHQDSTQVAERSVNTCLRCHSAAITQHASICPINAKSDCIQCHMPGINSNGFRLTDHWIGVHPELGITAKTRDERLTSLIAPKREYLQIVVVDNHTKAEAVQQRLARGESFYDVARDTSLHPTAPGGGFVGEMKLADMDARLSEAAAQLPYGGTSGIIDQGSQCVILHRLPRDFKWKANQLFEEAVALKAKGNRAAAIQKDEQALQAYPYFLRGLVFMGSTLAEAGDTQRASEILGFAAQSYPQDASAEFDFALTLDKQPADQIQAFRRAIELDPEMVAGYESLGAALASAGRIQEAIEVFRQGLALDPLAGILEYDLGLALRQQGDDAGAKRALMLASKLDPDIAARLSKR